MKKEVVMITGSSAGLGRAVAREFGCHGASIGLLARGVDGLEGAKREIESMGGRAIALPTDVADAEAVELQLALPTQSDTSRTKQTCVFARIVAAISQR